jgi:hypothetical protein
LVDAFEEVFGVLIGLKFSVGRIYEGDRDI